MFRPLTSSLCNRWPGLVWCAVLLALLIGLPAAAQGPQPTLQSAGLRLWPEYDDPGLLVIQSGDFSSAVSLPVSMTLPLPVGARGIQAAYLDASGGLLNQPYRATGGKLNYSVPLANFHAEYYLDRPPAGNQREVVYTFEAPYPTTALSVEIQQPARSTGFSVTPQPESSFQGSDGLTYFRLSRSNLAAGERLAITIRYSKTDQGLSSAPASAAPVASAPIGTSTPPGPAGGVLPYVLVGLGAAGLVGAGVYGYLQQRTERQASAAQGRRRPAGAKGAPTASAGGKAGFCTQCGSPLRTGDRFCAQCGTPQRN